MTMHLFNSKSIKIADYVSYFIKVIYSSDGRLGNSFAACARVPSARRYKSFRGIEGHRSEDMALLIGGMIFLFGAAQSAAPNKKIIPGLSNAKILLENAELGGIWLICCNCQIVGYIQDAFIDEFYIHANYRGKGLGRQVLDQIKLLAKAQGCNHFISKLSGRILRRKDCMLGQALRCGKNK